MYFVLSMPEIWLNYGITDVVLDIRAENLDNNINSDGKILEDTQIIDKFNQLDRNKTQELVILNYSKAIQKLLNSLFSFCEQKSLPIPRILADNKILNQLKEGLPEGSSVLEFTSEQIPNSDLTFVGEMELDGLFGFETIATRLMKKFGKENMLAAYAKRKGNLPAPGQPTESIEEAKKFVDNFEIKAIEIVANSKGIVDISIGHPSRTLSISKSFEALAIQDIGEHKTMIISTGKYASNDTLGRSLSSLWNCSSAIKNGGLAILFAECSRGIGSEAISQYIDGRLTLEKIRNPSKYVDGMENLLFLTELQKKFQIGLVSILPEFYAKKLNIISINSAKNVMEYILKTQGLRQKVAIVSDGARVLLR